MRRLPTAFLLLATVGQRLSGQNTNSPTGARVEHNVPFGNVANGTLLMDVHRPVQPNGKGIIFISGGGWGAYYAHDYEDTPLRADAEIDVYVGGQLVRGLVARGYTVFSIDHRFAPEARYPLPLYDCQRAVRFIRAHAAEYGIDPAHLGAIGHSSGAHLAALLGVTDTTIAEPVKRGGQQVPGDHPAQRGKSRVEAVVTLAAPFSFALSEWQMPEGFTKPGFASSCVHCAILNLFGALPERDSTGAFVLTGAYAAASPITHVNAETAPMLIYQAEDDPVVPKKTAELMYRRLQQAKVPSQLIMRPTGKHSPAYDLDEIDKWFRRYLQ